MITCCKDWFNLAKDTAKKHPYCAGAVAVVIILFIIFQFMAISFIKYGNRKIKVIYGKLDDCYGLFDPNTHTLHIDKRQTGMKLFNTLMHELFHIIIYYAGININERGEEPVAVEVGNGYAKVFKQNPKLWGKLTRILYGSRV